MQTLLLCYSRIWRIARKSDSAIVNRQFRNIFRRILVNNAVIDVSFIHVLHVFDAELDEKSLVTLDPTSNCVKMK